VRRAPVNRWVEAGEAKRSKRTLRLLAKAAWMEASEGVVEAGSEVVEDHTEDKEGILDTAGVEDNVDVAVVALNLHRLDDEGFKGREFVQQ
jgi:hypothetical protein